MTKSEFVDQIANRTGLARKDAATAVDAMLDTIQDTLRRGSEVTFSGFGKFHVSDRGARRGVNPRTGELIDIAATKVPRFTAGSGLKQAIKG
jgi:DNA-binding protein HU-beta